MPKNPGAVCGVPLCGAANPGYSEDRRVPLRGHDGDGKLKHTLPTLWLITRLDGFGAPR